MVDQSRLREGLACDATRLLSDVLTPLVGEEYLSTVDSAAIFRARLGVSASAGPGHFSAFINRMRNGRLAQILSTPAVSHWVQERVGGWATATHEALLRVVHDTDAIGDWAGVGAPLTLVRLHTGLGDPHNGGRTVCRAEFTRDPLEGPGLLSVAYKPRDLRAEKSFAEFTDVVCTAAGVEPPRLPSILDRCGEYGYSEWIDRADVSSEEAESFLRRMGNLLAILFLCHAEDCHYENFVCDGRALVPVDLEALCVPFRTSETTAALAGHQLVSQSVLRTGVLPQWSRIEGGGMIDTSLLGMICTDAGEMISEDWLDQNSDAMRWGVTSVRVARPNCSPGESVTTTMLRHGIADLSEGFREVLTPLTNPDRIQATLDALPEFCAFAVRRVHRPTRVYSLLLREASGPHAMTDRILREKVFNRLTKFPLPVDGFHDPTAVLDSELEQLSRGDIPYFSETTDPAADISGGWRRSLVEITPTSIEFNSRVITAAMVARFPDSEGLTPERSTDAPVEVARSELTALVGLRPIPETELLEPEAPDWSLYDGLWGTALLRGRDDPEVRALLERALEPGRLEEWACDAGPGLAGAGGLLRVLARLTRPSDFAAVSSRLLARYDDSMLASLDNPELLYGMAGLLRPLHSLSSADAGPGACLRDFARDVADAVAFRILDLQDRHTGGWSVPGLPNQLCGFSHGAAGIAAALSTVTTRPREIEDAIHAAFDFESQHRDAGTGNWRDLRPSASDDALGANSWCHGAAGIVMSRALIAHHRRSSASLVARALSDLDFGVSRVSDAQKATLDTLCCGTTGRAITARIAADALDAAGFGAHRSTLLRSAAAVQMRFASMHNRPRCSVRPDHERIAEFQPGFMNGTTGALLAREHEVDDLVW